MSNIDGLIGVVAEIDEIIMHLAIKNRMAPLTITAIVLARLVWLNKQAGTTENLVKLMEDVCQKIESKELDEEISKMIH